MSGHLQSRRAGKASIVVIVLLVGAACLILGGLCGGGLTMMFVARPAQVEVERAMAERDAVEHDATQLGKAAQTFGEALKVAIPQRSADAADTSASSPSARAVIENIRAGRPQAVLKRCSPEYRQMWYTENVTQQLAKYPLPLRTEALGDEMRTLPPIDDKTHQYRYTATTTDARPVTFTITMVLVSPDNFSSPEWLLDQLTITEGAAEKESQPAPKSP
jgi:hypothetical protein